MSESSVVKKERYRTPATVRVSNARLKLSDLYDREADLEERLDNGEDVGEELDAVRGKIAPLRKIVLRERDELRRAMNYRTENRIGRSAARTPVMRKNRYGI